MKRLALIYLLFLFLGIFLFVTPANSSSTTPVLQHPFIPTNVTVSSTAPFKQDPVFYSFEAYHLQPPNVTPVKVVIAKDLIFNDTGLKPYYLHVYVPPGNYSMEILNVTIKEFNGTQYDRPVYVFADGVPIFWGSTQEINNSTTEADVTVFENLLRGNVTFEAVIQNYYDVKVNITGLYELNMTLYLYPGAQPKGLPNAFIPLFVNATVPYNYSYVVLSPLEDSYTCAVTIPNGTYKVQALIYEEGGGLDEFWYTNEPATRSILVYYDSHLAGVVNPYETIYTGGIDLLYWKPLTSIDTLSFHNPYVIDLTPMLAYGEEANITVSVTNLVTALQLTGTPDYFWDIAGVLMLWVNSSNPLVNSTVITEYQRFLDSGPIFNQGFLGFYYQEGGSYLLNYTSMLYFKHGYELASTVQEGRFYAYQTFNNIYELANLSETFTEYAKDYGMYNYTLAISGSYPISMYVDSFATPITSPSVIPYNLSFEQLGEIHLGLNYYCAYSFNGYNVSSNIVENLKAKGGFGGIMEIINRYGGAVLVVLTFNNAVTIKNLNFTYLVNGKGFDELFSAEGIQNSTVNLNGYYKYVSEEFSSVGDPSPTQLVPSTYAVYQEMSLTFFREMRVLYVFVKV